MRKQSDLFRKVLKTLTGVFLAGLLLWTAVYGFESRDQQKNGMPSAAVREVRGPEPKASEAANRLISRQTEASPNRKGE